MPINKNFIFGIIPAYTTAVSFGFHITIIELIKFNCKSTDLNHHKFYILASIIFLIPIFSSILNNRINISFKAWAFYILFIHALTSFFLTSKKFEILLMARVLIGIFIGFTTTKMPMFISILADRKRGQFVPLFQMFILLGVFLGQLSTYLGKKYINFSTISAIFCIINLIAICLLHGNDGEQIQTQSLNNISDLLNEDDAWKSLFLAILICLTQQLCGIRGIIVYSNTLLKDFAHPEAITAVLGLFSVILTGVSSFLIEIFGRKPLLLISAAIISFSYCLFLFQTWPPLAIGCFYTGYSLGIGPICWLVANELFPFKYQKAANNICIMFHWVAASIVVATFEILLEKIGRFLFIGLFFLLLSFFIVIFNQFSETKGLAPQFQ